MTPLTVTIAVLFVLLIGLAMAVRVIKQYELGVLFRLGRVRGLRQPGIRLIIPFVDVLHRVSLRIVTLPIQSQAFITRDSGGPVSCYRQRRVTGGTILVSTGSHVELTIGTSSAPVDAFQVASVPGPALTLIQPCYVVPTR